MKNTPQSKWLLPVEKPPRYIQRYVTWDGQPVEGFQGRIYLLVGYCPDTLPYFMTP